MMPISFTDPRRSPVPRWLVAACCAALVGSALVGCGRPATEQECEGILERTARLELQERLSGADAKLVESEVQATKQAMRESMMSNCVGKRITDRALACVQEAETAKELAEDCFR